MTTDKNNQKRVETKKFSQSEFNPEEITELQIVDYLERNQFFFENYPNLANRLYFPHEVNGNNAYSILQWQNNNFREKIAEIETQKDSLIKAFNDICFVSQQFNELIKKILVTEKLSSIENQINAMMKKNFGYAFNKIYLTHPKIAQLQKPFDKNIIKAIKGYLNGNIVYIGSMEQQDIKSLGFKGELNSFVLIELAHKLGYLVFAHPKVDFNQDRKNTALLEILRSTISFKLSQFLNE